MAIILRLDRVMADRKMSLNELADKVGISNEKLRKKETYKDWDFDTVWEIEDGKSFPKLRKLEKMLKRL